VGLYHIFLFFIIFFLFVIFFFFLGGGGGKDPEKLYKVLLDWHVK